MLQNIDMTFMGKIFDKKHKNTYFKNISHCNMWKIYLSRCVEKKAILDLVTFNSRLIECENVY